MLYIKFIFNIVIISFVRCCSVGIITAIVIRKYDQGPSTEVCYKINNIVSYIER